MFTKSIRYNTHIVIALHKFTLSRSVYQDRRTQKHTFSHTQTET